MRSFIAIVQRGCDPLVDILLIVHGEEVGGSQHHQPSGSSLWAAYC